jgi:hypothetical protein
VQQQIFQEQKKENLKGIFNELEANSKSKNSTNVCTGRIILREIGYQLRTNMVSDKNGDLLADSQIILIGRRSSYVSY